MAKNFVVATKSGNIGSCTSDAILADTVDFSVSKACNSQIKKTLS